MGFSCEGNKDLSGCSNASVAKVQMWSGIPSCHPTIITRKLVGCNELKFPCRRTTWGETTLFYSLRIRINRLQGFYIVLVEGFLGAEGRGIGRGPGQIATSTVDTTALHVVLESIVDYTL